MNRPGGPLASARLIARGPPGVPPRSPAGRAAIVGAKHRAAAAADRRPSACRAVQNRKLSSIVQSSTFAESVVVFDARMPFVSLMLTVIAAFSGMYDSAVDSDS